MLNKRKTIFNLKLYEQHRKNPISNKFLHLLTWLKRISDKFIYHTPKPLLFIVIISDYWYYYYYYTKQSNTCLIKQVPFRNVSCSDAAGQQVGYTDILLKSQSADVEIINSVFHPDALSLCLTYKVGFMNLIQWSKSF